MATTYNTAFGSLPGYNELLGTTNTTGGGQQQTYQPTATTTTRPLGTQPTVAPAQAGQTFAQLQRQGMARPAPPTTPAVQAAAQYGGSTEAEAMRQRLKSQLETFGAAPSRFDTAAFQQIRGAQAANLQQEYRGQLQALNEELARRGLSASSVGGGRMGDLAGQQARALASLDAQLLQQAAETQAADRAQLLAAQQGFAALAGTQDLAAFEANQAAKAAEFENKLRAAQLEQQQYAQYGQEALSAAQAEQQALQQERQFALQSGELTGLFGGMETLASRQQAEQQRQFTIQQALQQVLGLGGLQIQQAGLTGQLPSGTAGAAAQQTLAAQQQQFQQRQVLYQQAQQMSQQSGVQYTVNERGEVVPLRDAQGNVVRTSDFTQAEEARKLQSEELTLRRQLGLMEATGQGLTVDSEGRLVPATGTAAQTIQARQLAYQNAARLSEQSGVQYTVKADGTVDVLRDAQGNPVRTSAFTQAEEARKQQQEQFNIAQFGKAGTIQTGTQTLAALQQALQEAGVTGKFEGQLTQDALQNAYVRAAQLTQETGIRHTVNPTTGEITAMTGTGASTLEARLREAGITGKFGGELTQEALQNAYARAAQLSQITGQQYTVNPATGAITPATGEAGRTFAAQLQAAGITGQFGGALTQDALQNAYQRAAQLSQITGVQYDVDPKTGAISPKAGTTAGTQAETLAAQLQRAGLTGTLGGQATLERLQQNLQQAQILSQITGKQYTVNDKGELVPAGEKPTQTEAARQFDLEQKLRGYLGLTEAAGFVYNPFTGEMQKTAEGKPQETVQGQIGRSQVLLALANSLGNLTPEQIAQLLGKASPTAPPGDGGPTSTTPPNTADDGRLGAGQTELLQTITAPDNPREGWLYNIGGTLVRYKADGKYYRMDGSIFTPGTGGPTTTSTTSPPGGPTTTSTTRPPGGPTTTSTTAPPGGPTTTTPTGTISSTPLTDNERQIVTSSLLGDPFEGRYLNNAYLGGWVVYKGGNWYKYSGNPPMKQISWNGQQINVYPGYAIYDYSQGGTVIWDGNNWIPLSTTFG